MNKVFDLKNVTEDDLYIGDLYIITSTNKDYTRSVLAKRNATLIKLFDNHFIDLDSIKSNNSIDIINELILNNVKESNIIISDVLDKPYIGQLFVGTLDKSKKISENILKLKNTLK